LVFLNELYNQLGVSKSLISTLTLNLDKFYYKHTQPKKKFGKDQKDEHGNIKYRHLLPPVKSLKEVQERICNHLQKIDLPDCMYGAIAGSNNVFNALQHIENKYFFTVDLKNFFTKINNKQVHSTFIENGYCWNAARILTKLTTYNYGLPQGAPTSPVIANLAFKQTALKLVELIKYYDITFTIFLDDLTFSSKKDFKHLHAAILERIRADNFYTHHKKIHYRENICDVTGLFVGNGKLKMHPQMLEEAKTNYHVKNYVEYVQECYNEYLVNKFNP
jgi:RNA-directed DNA polymerase